MDDFMGTTNPLDDTQNENNQNGNTDPTSTEGQANNSTEGNSEGTSQKEPTTEPGTEPKEGTEGTEGTKGNTDPSPEGDQVHTFKDTDTHTDIINHLTDTFSSERDAELFQPFLESQDIRDLPEDAIKKVYGTEGLIKIQGAIPEFKADQDKAVQETLAVVQKAVGGEQVWEDIKTFAKEELSPESLAIYKEQLDKGGKQAEEAAKALYALHKTSKNTTTSQGSSLQGERTMTTTELQKPSDYISQADAAREGYKANHLGDTVAMADINNRRIKSMEYEQKLAEQSG